MKTKALAVALVAGALLGGLLLAEGLLRLLRLAPTEGLTTVTADQFLAVPGILSPGRQFVDLRNRQLPHRVTVDSLGFRGPELARQKPAGSARVLMLGDSFVYGDFVDDSSTLPAQLERRLRLMCGAVEVINAGLPGSSITEHLPLAQRTLDLGPDVVVLAFTENDVSDLAGEPMWTQLARNRAAKSAWPMSWVYPMLRRSALWNLAMQVRGRVRAGRRPAQGVTDSAGQRGVIPDTVLRRRYADGVRALSQELQRRGIPLVFLTYPAHFTVYGTWSTEQVDWAAAVAAAEGIEVVTALPALRRSGKPETELFLLPYDGHPSALGYSFAAETLAAALTARGLPRPACHVPDA